MNNLDDFVPEWIEMSRLNSTTPDILEFNVIDKIIRNTDIDVYVYNEPSPTWRKFPSKHFKLQNLVFEKRAEITDVISVNFSADGLMVSEKFKKILEKFDLGNHRFYPATIFDDKTKQYYIYYWLHFIFDETIQNYIDYSNSTFLVQEKLEGEIVNQFDLKFDNQKQYSKFCKNAHDLWVKSEEPIPFKEVKIKFLKLKKKTPDIIGFGRVDSDLYCTKKLRLELEYNHITGIVFKGSNRISYEFEVL